MLREQINGRLRLSDVQRKTLAELGKQLGKHALADIASVTRPDTILAWHLKLVAKQCDGNAQRNTPGRPHID